MGEFLTIKEVAEVLKVSQRTVRNWIDSGTLKASRFGLQYRVKKTDFDEFITQSEIKNNNSKGDI